MAGLAGLKQVEQPLSRGLRERLQAHLVRWLVAFSAALVRGWVVGLRLDGQGLAHSETP